MARNRLRKSRPGSVRIIGGDWRRRQIPVVGGADLRPTPDRVRETLFNWLGPGIAGAACLDLYAGTGVLGFEALSRGAARVVFVERNPAAVTALISNRDALQADATILAEDVSVFLRRSQQLDFDLVFVDPPYGQSVDEPLRRLLELLRPEALVYLERDRAGAWPEPVGLSWRRRGSAGSVAFGLGEVTAATRV